MGPMKKQAMKRGGKPVATKRGGKAKKQVMKKRRKRSNLWLPLIQQHLI